MAGDAVGLVLSAAGVRVGGLLGVAVRAGRAAGVLEASVLEVVAVLAYGLAPLHVRLVSRARAVLLPGRRHELRWNTGH
jgi:hypothetical protein